MRSGKYTNDEGQRYYMRHQNLLWLAGPGQMSEAGWQDHLVDLEISHVANLNEAQRAFATSDFGCIFVSIRLPDLQPVEILEFFQSLNATIPVIIWEEEMTV